VRGRETLSGTLLSSASCSARPNYAAYELFKPRIDQVCLICAMWMSQQAAYCDSWFRTTMMAFHITCRMVTVGNRFNAESEPPLVNFRFRSKAATDRTGLQTFNTTYGASYSGIRTHSGPSRRPSLFAKPVRAYTKSVGLSRSSPFFNPLVVHLCRIEGDLRTMAGVAHQSQKANFNQKGELYSCCSGISPITFSLRKINAL